MARKLPFGAAGATALTVTALAGLLLYFLDYFLDSAPWRLLHVAQATITYFCEATQVDHFIRQPTNTYTNLGYLAVGIYILLSGRRGLPGTFLGRHPSYGWIYAGLALLTFLGSTFFHASLSVSAEWMDLVAVYGITGIPLAVACHLYFRANGAAGPVIAVWALGWLLASLFVWEIPVYISVPGVVLLAGILFGLVHRKHRIPSRWSLVGGLGGAVLGGMACFFGDIARIGCVPGAWLHPHGVWHLSAAAAALFFFLYLRSFPDIK